MRWFWIDRFTEFRSGHSATALKSVSLSEDYLHDHFPAYPVMPASLILEGLAQTAGLLIGEHSGFTQRVILAKVSRVQFRFLALPGDTLTYRATIIDINEDGAMAKTTSHVGDRLQGEADIFFAHIKDDVAGEDLFEPQGFLDLLRMLRMFEVGRQSDGSPIEVPEKFRHLQGA